jgi:3-dehydroquinate synthase
MIAATRLARTLNMVNEDFSTRLETLINRAGLPTSHPDKPGLFDRVQHTMLMDKKFRDGKNLFVLPTKIGAWQQRENVDWALVDETVRSVLR